MTRTFIRHSSVDNEAAIAHRNWLNEKGWRPEVLFPDVDRDAGIPPVEK